MLSRLLRAFSTPVPGAVNAPIADSPHDADEPGRDLELDLSNGDWGEVRSVGEAPDVGGTPPAQEGEVGVAHAATPADQPIAEPAAGTLPVSAAERALMLSVMRVAPDVRYRAARSLGLLTGLDGRAGVELERALLARAHEAGKLTELDEAIAR